MRKAVTAHPTARRLRPLWRIVASSAVMACAMVTDVQAQEAPASRACLVEWPLSAMGTTTWTTDCLQATPDTRRTALNERCHGVAQHAATGLGRQNIARLTWLPQCPRQDADAVCQGAFDGDFDHYYYDRDDSQLDNLSDECEALGGRWRELDN